MSYYCRWPLAIFATMESVNTWFDNGCGYWPGVELYASLPGKKPMLLRNLQKKESAENLVKLKYELEAFRKVTKAAPVSKPVPAAPIPPVAAVPSKPIPKPHTPVYFQNLPAALRPVLLEANNYHREACMLKAELNDVAGVDEKACLTLQLKIFSLLKKNALCWEQIDHWERHGKILTIEKPQPLSEAKLHKRQALLFSSTSKLKKRLKGNIDKLEAATNLKERTRLEKNVAKQSANLLRQETELQAITSLIENGE